MDAALPGRTLAEEVGKGAQAAPIGGGGDGAVLEALPVDGPDVHDAVVPEQTVRVADQREDADVLIAGAVFVAHEIGGGGHLADVPGLVHGYRTDHGTFVQIFRGKQVGAVVFALEHRFLALVERCCPVKASVRVQCVVVGLLCGVGDLDGVCVALRLRRGSGAVQSVIDRTALRSGDGEGKVLVIEATGRGEYRLLHQRPGLGLIVGRVRSRGEEGKLHAAVLGSAIGRVQRQSGGQVHRIHHAAALTQTEGITPAQQVVSEQHAGLLQRGLVVLPDAAHKVHQQPLSRLHSGVLGEAVAVQIELPVAQAPTRQGNGLFRGVVQLRPAVAVAVRRGELALTVSADLIEDQMVRCLGFRGCVPGLGVASGDHQHRQQAQTRHQHRQNRDSAAAP